MTGSLQAVRIDTNGHTQSPEGSAAPLRVHVRQTLDVGHGFDSTLTLADIEEACTALRGWLEEFLGGKTAGAAGGAGE